MSDATITYFPVKNGDTILIRLSDNTIIVIDSNITQDSREASQTEWYDVHAHLLEELRKDGDVSYVDAFILTHPDTDHCLGFKDTFYTGDPAKYGDEHAKEGLIRIDELWFSPRIFSPHE
jgi:glyoxylase-like metal-dependent hydrolase (beta-lactamase superfamily II)